MHPRADRGSDSAQSLGDAQAGGACETPWSQFPLREVQHVRIGLRHGGTVPAASVVYSGGRERRMLATLSLLPATSGKVKHIFLCFNCGLRVDIRVNCFGK